MIRQDFNKQWLLGDATTAFQVLIDRMGKKTQKQVNLPHDAMISAERDKDSPGGGAIGFFLPQDVEYKKKFYVSEEDKGKVFFVEFEGVYTNAVVRVNGNYAGKCGQGYTDFFVRINDYLEYGSDNEISVNVWNSAQPNSRWYTGTGIYRNVKLLVGEPLYIVPDGLRVTTLDAEKDLAALRIETDLKNEEVMAKTGYLITKIKDTEENIICEDKVKFTVRSGEQITVEHNIYLKNPKLWSPDDPNMHICEVVVNVDGEEVDYDSTKFGIRKLQLDTVNGLRINGKSYKMKGGCIHHDNGVLGAATFEDAEERRVRLLKDAGYNAIRSAHNPISKALLDACDKYGFMVMDEYSDIWTVNKSKHDYAFQLPDHWEDDLERLVKRDYNHPSVIMYSIGNEIPETGKKITAGIARKFIEKIRSLDTTRYITNGINPMVSCMDRLIEIAVAHGGNKGEVKGEEINEIMSNFKILKEVINQSPIVDAAIEESCDMLDIVGYNYATSRYSRDHAKHPNRILVGAETFPADLVENWEEVQKHPHVLGDFSWTAWDYLGEAGLGNIRYPDTKDQFYGAYPWVTAWCGDFDITGYRRPVSYWREIVWGGRNHVPYIAVQKPERYGQEAIPSTWSFTDAISSWTWPGYEGKNVIAEVYSDADEVELFINGKSLGKKPVGDEFKQFYCKWDTVYEAGQIEAVSYIGGNEVGRYKLCTAGAPKLRVSKETDSIRAGSNDLCYVNIELVDEAGNLNCGEDKVVSLNVEGPAVIQGSGSGNPTTEENYFDSKHKTFYGRALAVVRALEEKGTALLTVSVDGMDDVTIEIPVV